jgi:hypothetical protein
MPFNFRIAASKGRHGNTRQTATDGRAPTVRTADFRVCIIQDSPGLTLGRLGLPTYVL